MTLRRGFGMRFGSSRKATAAANTAPTDIALAWRLDFAGGNVRENVPSGTVLADISGTDPQGQALTFTETVDADAKFSVSGSTLVLSAALDYETKTSHSVTIRATDTGGLTYDKAFTVTVTNTTEPAAQSKEPAAWVSGTDDTYPSYDNFIWWAGRRWIVDNAKKTWSVSSADNNIIRFETRAGDQWTQGDAVGTHRNKLNEDITGGPAHLTADVARCKFDFNIGTFTNTASFFQLFEFHTFGSPNVLSSFLELDMLANGRLVLYGNYWDGSATQFRTLWTAPSAISRDTWHSADIFAKNDTSGTTGRLYLAIDGSVVYDSGNTLRTGYPNSTNYNMMMGIYRGGTPLETAVVSYRNPDFKFAGAAVVP